jgi:outer membrane protein OmpA-like peptidoglycan-associated protein
MTFRLATLIGIVAAAGTTGAQQPQPPAKVDQPVQAFVIERAEKRFTLTVSLAEGMSFNGRRIWVTVPGWPFRGGRVDFSLFVLLGAQDDLSKRESVFSSSQNVLPVEETMELVFDLPDIPDGRYLVRAKAAMHQTAGAQGFESVREQVFVRGQNVHRPVPELGRAVVQVDGYQMNQTELSREQRALWKARLKDMSTVELVALYVEGHTCHKGTSAANEIVSTRRAQNVVEFLREMGIDPEKIQVVPMIDSSPIVATEGDETAAQKNRRVVVRVLYKKR